MQNITISRYRHPRSTGWAGWLEPADHAWIAFIGLDGHARFFLSRDPVSGAIVSDDPAEQAADIGRLREEGGLRTGQVYAGPDDPASSLAPGERCHPLGETGGGGDVVPRGSPR